MSRTHVFTSWSAQALINPVNIVGAEGSWMWDDAGTRYLDFSSQLMNVNIGHQHPKLIAAIQEAAGRLCTIAPFHATPDRTEAARLVCERLGVSFQEVKDWNCCGASAAHAIETELAVALAARNLRCAAGMGESRIATPWATASAATPSSSRASPPNGLCAPSHSRRPRSRPWTMGASASFRNASPRCI